MYVIEIDCGLVKRGFELVDCGKIVIFNLGGNGKGFLVDGRFDGNLYGGFLVVFSTGFVGLGLKVDCVYCGRVILYGLYVGLGNDDGLVGFLVGFGLSVTGEVVTAPEVVTAAEVVTAGEVETSGIFTAIVSIFSVTALLESPDTVWNVDNLIGTSIIGTTTFSCLVVVSTIVVGLSSLKILLSVVV